MKTTKHLITKLACFALIAVVAVAMLLTVRVKAFNPQPDPPAFGLISLNPGQTLRLNVVNRLQPPPEPDRRARATRHTMLGFDLYRSDARGSASNDVPPGPCITMHAFAQHQSCEIALEPGEAASFDLVPATDGAITQVLPTLQDDDRNQHPALFYTLEVRENGKTLYVLPAVQNTWAGRTN